LNPASAGDASCAFLFALSSADRGAYSAGLGRIDVAQAKPHPVNVAAVGVIPFDQCDPPLRGRHLLAYFDLRGRGRYRLTRLNPCSRGRVTSGECEGQYRQLVIHFPHPLDKVPVSAALGRRSARPGLFHVEKIRFRLRHIFWAGRCGHSFLRQTTAAASRKGQCDI